MPGRGTNEGGFIIELDGVSSIRAMNVSGGAINHTPTLINEGNRPNPTVTRGNYEIDELTINQASALNDTGLEFYQWLRDFLDGLVVEPRTFRLVVLDEDGSSPVEIWEYLDVIPTSLQPNDRAARGQNPAAFTFKVKPSDAILL